MIKKITYISLLLVLFLFSTSIVQAENLELDLEKAINMALEKNLQLKEEKINLEKAELQYEKSMANNIGTQSEYNELNAEITLKNAQNSYQSTMDSMIKNVVQQYTNLWLTEYNLQLQEKRQNLQKQLLTESEKKFEIGEIGNVSLLEQENAFQDAKYNLKKANDNFEQSLREFKTTLGIDLSANLEFDDLEIINEWEISKEEVIDKTLENNLQIELQQFNRDLAKLNLERSKISSSDIDKKIAEKDLEIAEMTLKRNKRDLENSSIMTYYDYQHALEEIELKQNNFEKAKEDYELKKEQYNKGLIKESDLLNFEISMLQAEYDYFSAISNYYNKRLALRQEMGIELEVVEDDSN